MNKKFLIIVDAQIDFISGNLAVPNADVCIDNLINILSNNNDYSNIYMTLDWHPDNHLSFETFPPHCIQHSVGAAIYPPLLSVVGDKNIMKLTKGNLSNKEEFSVFDNYFSGYTLRRELELKAFDEIHVAGIAGDYCVTSTIEDLIKLGYKDKIVVMTECIASIDGGEKLKKLIEKYNLKNG